MTYQVSDIIKHSIEDEPASLKDALNSIMYDKIKAQLDNKYAEVANSIYGDEDNEEDDTNLDEFDVDSEDVDHDEFVDDSDDDSPVEETDDEDEPELAEEGYEPNPKEKSNPEVQFIAKHIIKQFGVINGKDFAGNSVDGPPYKGNVETYKRPPMHGYDHKGQDKKVYD